MYVYMCACIHECIKEFIKVYFKITTTALIPESWESGIYLILEAECLSSWRSPTIAVSPRGWVTVSSLSVYKTECLSWTAWSWKFLKSCWSLFWNDNQETVVLISGKETRDSIKTTKLRGPLEQDSRWPSFYHTPFNLEGAACYRSKLGLTTSIKATRIVLQPRLPTQVIPISGNQSQ